MLLIGLLARLQLRRLDGIAYLIDLGPGEPFLLELIDNLAYLAPIYHAGLFYLDLYIGFAGKGDDGQYWQRLIILQDTSQRTDVAGILQDRVVELVFVTVDVLRPVLGVLTAVNPAVVVLGLDDEDAIYRHDQVVYLGTAFWCRYRHIIQHPVLVFRQVIQFPRDYFLSDLTLRRNQPSEQEEKPDDYNDSDYEGGGFHSGISFTDKVG